MRLTEYKNKNTLFWDIVKGLGILCIVIGHACGSFFRTVSFVYLFHLSVFFFVSGFLYSEEKYGDYPHINFSARLRSNWPKYVGYMSLYVILHNAFIHAGIIINEPEYSFADIIVHLVSATVFDATETIGGALWFVPVLLVASGLFGILVYVGRKVQRATGNKASKIIVVLLLSMLLGAVGVYSNLHGMYFRYHIQTSFLVIPLFASAWLIRTHIKNWIKHIHWLPGILAVVSLCYGLIALGWQIELSMNIINGPIDFYVISLLGIYACLTLAKYLTYVPMVRSAFAFIGKYSFDIMAGHFLAIKAIDVIYARIIGETDPMVYGRFPQAYCDDLWWLYLIAATLCPAIIAFLWDKAKMLVAQKLSIHQ